MYFHNKKDLIKYIELTLCDDTPLLVDVLSGDEAQAMFDDIGLAHDVSLQHTMLQMSDLVRHGMGLNFQSIKEHAHLLDCVSSPLKGE